MKKTVLFLSVAFVLLSVVSCSRVGVALYNKKDSLKKKTVWVKGDKEIVFIPMIHVAKAGYYEQVKDFLFQKRNEGYIIYYEGVANGGVTPQQRDTLYLKARKIMGFYIFQDYTEKENKSIPKYLKKYIGQNYKNTGIDTLRDVCADMTYKDMIAKIETERGKIELEPCDFETPLNAPYKCTQRKDLGFTFIRTLRDDYLKQLLLNSPDKKIVVLYGQAHTWAVYPALEREGFCLVQGKWLRREKKECNNVATITTN